MNATILDTRIRPTDAPGAVENKDARRDLACLFALDRLPGRPSLVCHWHRDADGRLAAAWELDVAPDGQR
jgi:hypothetical protein